MKDWLKKIKNEIIIDILKNCIPINFYLKVPDDFDLYVRVILRNISKKIKSK